MKRIRVLVSGAKGRMGTTTARAVGAASDLLVVAETDVGDDLAAAIAESRAEVVVDFTVPASAAANTRTILESGARPVVGTTGFTPEDIESIRTLAAAKRLGAVIAPNFSLGMVLLERFAAEAVRHFPSVEIIELHHDRKLDAPSGTAVHTAELLADARPVVPAPPDAERITVPGARGGAHRDIRIHSIRLPGLLAHQEVLFGGPGQVLTLRHDTLDREAFMPGVLLAIRKSLELDHLVVGLEQLIP
jgi:4-hydroxy-tetrahydrodipicolinate reductase